MKSAAAAASHVPSGASKAMLDLFGGAELAENEAAERGKIRLRQFLGAANADHQKTLGGKTMRRENIEGAERLSFEIARSWRRWRSDPPRRRGKPRRSARI